MEQLSSASTEAFVNQAAEPEYKPASAGTEQKRLRYTNRVAVSLLRQRHWATSERGATFVPALQRSIVSISSSRH